MRRVDVEDGFVNIYVREVRSSERRRATSLRREEGITRVVLHLQMKKSEERTHLLTLEEDVPVRNLKPAVVKVYDYYQTSKSLAAPRRLCRRGCPRRSLVLAGGE